MSREQEHLRTSLRPGILRAAAAALRQPPRRSRPVRGRSRVPPPSRGPPRRARDGRGRPRRPTRRVPVGEGHAADRLLLRREGRRRERAGQSGHRRPRSSARACGCSTRAVPRTSSSPASASGWSVSWTPRAAAAFDLSAAPVAPLRARRRNACAVHSGAPLALRALLPVPQRGPGPRTDRERRRPRPTVTRRHRIPPAGRARHALRSVRGRRARPRREVPGLPPRTAIGPRHAHRPPTQRRRR